MLPLLLLIGVAAVAFGMSSKASAPGGAPGTGPRVIPGPASANVNALPPGSIVATHDSAETITIVSQGPLGYFGHTMISGAAVTFKPSDITLINSVGPALAAPVSIASVPLPKLPPAVTSGRWY